jgi:hypothetical protein
MATWRDKIAACFGTADLDFAKHPADEGWARAAIKAAKKAGATREDFWKEILGHLYPLEGPGVSKEHAEVQRKRFLKLWPQKR